MTALIVVCMLIAAVIFLVAFRRRDPMVTRTTPSGVPIMLCSVCGGTHPITRTHCPICGIPSSFPHKTHPKPKETIHE